MALQRTRPRLRLGDLSILFVARKMLSPLLQLAAISACIAAVNAHGSHGQEDVVDADWAVS